MRSRPRCRVCGSCAGAADVSLRPAQSYARFATCLGFGGARIDAAVAEEIVRVVEPVAIEAALETERMHHQRQNQRRRILELDLQQARYDAGLAERRYAACDPENRLIAAQLEKN